MLLDTALTLFCEMFNISSLSGFNPSRHINYPKCNRYVAIQLSNTTLTDILKEQTDRMVEICFRSQTSLTTKHENNIKIKILAILKFLQLYSLCKVLSCFTTFFHNVFVFSFLPVWTQAAAVLFLQHLPQVKSTFWIVYLQGNGYTPLSPL